MSVWSWNHTYHDYFSNHTYDYFSTFSCSLGFLCVLIPIYFNDLQWILNVCCEMAWFVICDFFCYFPFFWFLWWVWMWCQNRISEAFSTGDILHVSLIQNKKFYALIYLIFTTDLSLIWNEVFYALICLFSQLGSLIFLLIHALALPFSIIILLDFCSCFEFLKFSLIQKSHCFYIYFCFVF